MIRKSAELEMYWINCAWLANHTRDINYNNLILCKLESDDKEIQIRGI